MTWLPFSYSNLDVTMYRGWRKNDSWAIRVRYNWKFDIVLQSLRRIQYIPMNNDAIETWFAWRDYHFLIQIWTWPCIEVDGKMIRGRFGWSIIESLTLFFKACVVYNISADRNTDAIDRDLICMTWLPFSYSNLDVTMYRGWRKNDSWAIRVSIIESLTLFFKACVVYNISPWIMMRKRHDLHDVTTIFLFKFGRDHV